MKTCLKTTELPLPIALIISTSECSNVVKIQILIYSNLRLVWKTGYEPLTTIRHGRFIFGKDPLKQSIIARGGYVMMPSKPPGTCP
jgi:hypothetical protein